MQPKYMPRHTTCQSCGLFFECQIETCSCHSSMIEICQCLLEREMLDLSIPTPTSQEENKMKRKDSGSLPEVPSSLTLAVRSLRASISDMLSLNRIWSNPALESKNITPTEAYISTCTSPSIRNTIATIVDTSTSLSRLTDRIRQYIMGTSRTPEAREALLAFGNTYAKMAECLLLTLLDTPNSTPYPKTFERISEIALNGLTTCQSRVCHYQDTPSLCPMELTLKRPKLQTRRDTTGSMDQPIQEKPTGWNETSTVFETTKWRNPNTHLTTTSTKPSSSTTTSAPLQVTSSAWRTRLNTPEILPEKQDTIEDPSLLEQSP